MLQENKTNDNIRTDLLFKSVKSTWHSLCLVDKKKKPSPIDVSVNSTWHLVCLVEDDSALIQLTFFVYSILFVFARFVCYFFYSRNPAVYLYPLRILNHLPSLQILHVSSFTNATDVATTNIADLNRDTFSENNMIVTNSKLRKRA